jgi:deazaflavin-dependent oxidoreductase (nitroreductase family)
MTTTTSQPAPIRSAVPSPQVMRAVNPIVSAILRSPFHRLLSRSVLLLSVTGRRTGRSYTTPVGYTREGDVVTVFSSGHRWCTNLRGGAAVTVRLEGRERIGRAELIEDRARVMDEFRRYVARFGLRDGGRRVGIALDERQPPTSDELASALAEFVVIKVTLVATQEE